MDITYLCCNVINVGMAYLRYNVVFSRIFWTLGSYGNLGFVLYNCFHTLIVRFSFVIFLPGIKESMLNASKIYRDEG